MVRINTALGLAAVGLIGPAVPNGAPPLPPQQLDISCTADSGKAFDPALSPQDICDRFVGALGNRNTEVRIALRFSLRGMASADVALLRAGQWHTLPLHELSVMDRRFNASDIDRLAQDVMNAMTAASPS